MDLAQTPVICITVASADAICNRDTALRGWRLLALLAGAFAPEPNMRPFLEAQLIDDVKRHISGADFGQPDEVALAAGFVLSRMRKACAYGSRQLAPLSKEIEATEVHVHLKSIQIVCEVKVSKFVVPGSQTSDGPHPLSRGRF
jgi:hypothetical protein